MIETAGKNSDGSMDDGNVNELEEQREEHDTSPEPQAKENSSSTVGHAIGSDGTDQCEEANDDEGDREQPHADDISDDRPSFMVRTAERFPRLYHLCMGVVLPLLALICLSLLFGYGLARLEAPGEMESNDATLRKIYQDYIDYQVEQEAVRNAIENVHPECLVEFDDNVTFNALNYSNPDLFPYLDTCYRKKAEDRYATLGAREYYASLFLLLDFNWLSCPRSYDEGENPGVGGKDADFTYRSFDQRLQTKYYVTEFNREFLNLSEEGQAMGLEEADAIEYGVQRASGGAGCKAHIAAGALFWFTVMTTIGYGNTAPVTDGGRALVFTLGFVSIIAFTALIGQAGYVILTIVDHAFQQRRWSKPLSRGLPAVLFWLAALVLWMVFFAQMARVYDARRRGYDDLSLYAFKDAIWFAYITMTTVGFGDIHLSHEEFVVADMFYLPLIVLLGFVWLANFALKLSVFLMELFPADENPLEDLLVRQQEGNRNDETST